MLCSCVFEVLLWMWLMMEMPLACMYLRGGGGEGGSHFWQCLAACWTSKDLSELLQWDFPCQCTVM